MQQSPDNPELQAAQLAERLSQHMSQYGYALVSLPTIEEADLFLTKAGDQAISRLFTFDRFGKQLALRPEFTTLAARKYVREHPDSDEIVRWQFRGLVYEDDPSKIERSYQRMSVGSELIGTDSSLASAEVVDMALAGLGEVLDEDPLTLKIGHVGLLKATLAHFQLDRRTERFIIQNINLLIEDPAGDAALLSRFDELLLGRATVGQDRPSIPTEQSVQTNTQHMLDVMLDATQRGGTMGGRTRHDIVQRLLQKQQRYAERDQVVSALHLLNQLAQVQAPPEEAFEQMHHLLSKVPGTQSILQSWRDAVLALDLPHQVVCLIRPGLARSLDYYTGLTFEIYGNDGRILAGGGRYDELIGLMGSSTGAPAFGFAYYVDNITPQISLERAQATQALRIGGSKKSAKAILYWANGLRSHGISVEVALGQDEAAEIFIDEQGRAVYNQISYEDVVTLLQVMHQETSYDA